MRVSEPVSESEVMSLPMSELFFSKKFVSESCLKSCPPFPDAGSTEQLFALFDEFKKMSCSHCSLFTLFARFVV